MTSRAASRREHRRFCEIEGWQEVRNSRGKPTQHHLTYELLVDDGNVLRTRISRPANAEVYGAGLWSHILRDQLQVSEAEFWECVDNENPPARARTSKDYDAPALPLALAYQLVHTLHLTSEEIGVLTFEEAMNLLRDYWARPQTE